MVRIHVGQHLEINDLNPVIGVSLSQSRCSSESRVIASSVAHPGQPWRDRIPCGGVSRERLHHPWRVPKGQNDRQERRCARCLGRRPQAGTSRNCQEPSGSFAARRPASRRLHRQNAPAGETQQVPQRMGIDSSEPKISHERWLTFSRLRDPAPTRLRCYSTAIMTLEALITAKASLPSLRPRDCADVL